MTPRPVVVVDRHVEALGTARHRAADAPHADDAQPLAVHPTAEHAGGRPALPVAPPHHTLALRQAPRHREDERPGHVGAVLGAQPRRVGDNGAALARRLPVDGVYAIAEGDDELYLRAGSGPTSGVDKGGYSGSQ